MKFQKVGQNGIEVINECTNEKCSNKDAKIEILKDNKKVEIIQLKKVGA